MDIKDLIEKEANIRINDKRIIVKKESIIIAIARNQEEVYYGKIPLEKGDYHIKNNVIKEEEFSFPILTKCEKLERISGFIITADNEMYIPFGKERPSVYIGKELFSKTQSLDVYICEIMKENASREEPKKFVVIKEGI